MIEAKGYFKLAIKKDNEKAEFFCELVCNMGKMLEEGVIDNEIYYEVHEKLRVSLGTEDFIHVIGHKEVEGLENTVSFLILHFPLKADGNLYEVIKEDGRYYLNNV